jgi:hypothetical protein
MGSKDKQALIAEETFMIIHSGEIPEVTYHGSLYYLTEDPEGPGLLLNSDDISPLKQSVVERYRAIILRDIDPGNRDKGIYRGVARCLANWQRLLKFCARENMDYLGVQDEAAPVLHEFLKNEIDEVVNGNRSSCINCSAEDIATLVHFLGLSPADLPEGWQDLCPAG